MQAGKLRHRVTIQDYTEAADSYGERIRTYSDTATVWASIEPLTGRELLQAQQISAETTHQVRMRHMTITAQSRLLFGTRTFDIASLVNPDERSAELVLLCKEIG